MEDTTAADDLASICRTLRLRLVERLDVLDGGAAFLAHVEDREGRQLVLKRGSGLRGSGEFRVLDALQGSGVVPGSLQQVDALTFLCEWIDGVTFDRSALPAEGLLAQVGAALHLVHQYPAPGGLMPIRERASPVWVERDLSPLLPTPYLEAARHAAAVLAAYDDADAVLLHGDVVERNVLEAGGRIILIDPIGFHGPAGWDVAQLAVACTGRDRRENLSALVAGYGSTPPRLREAFHYLAFLFLGKNLEMEATSPGSGTRVIEELSVLAEALAAERAQQTSAG